MPPPPPVEPRDVKVPSALTHPASPSARFRRAVAAEPDESYSYKRFDRLRPLAEQLDPGSLANMVRAAHPDSSQYQLLLHLWAEHDPRAALEYVLEPGWDEFGMQRFAAAAMPAWAKIDPGGAIRWLEERHGELGSIRGGIAAGLRSELLCGLAQHHPELALDLIREHRLGGGSLTKRLFSDRQHWHETGGDGPHVVGVL